MNHQQLIDQLNHASPGAVLSSTDFRGDLTLTLNAAALVAVCTFLRDDPDCSFDMLIDLCGADLYRPEDRFEVIYTLYSTARKSYLRLKVSLEEQEPVVPTVTGVWAGANWHERETYDMFGIRFSGHPDLRRLYLPEEFEHYPLRKDFPLMGIPDSIPLPRR